MNRMYNVVFTAVTVTVQQDFFEIVAAAAKPLLIHELTISTESAVNEQLRIAVKRGQTTSGSGGSSFTPLPLDGSDSAAGFTSEINNTTKATAGTIVTLFSDVLNINAGYVKVWTPETRIIVGGGVRATVELLTTPGASRTISGVLTLEEIG